MEEIKYSIHRQKEIDHPKHQTNNRLPSSCTSNLRIEDKFSCCSQYQGKIYQFDCFHAQLSIDVLDHTRFPQQIVLIDPVENCKAYDDQHCACGDDRAVEIGEPNRLYDFCVSFTHAVPWILHEIVGLALGVLLLTCEALPLRKFEEVPGVDKPDKGDEEGHKEEHDRLCFNHSVLLAVDVVEGEIFNEEGHDGGGEEEAKGVFKAEGEFVFTACAMFLDVGDKMEDEGEQKFVE